MGDAEVLDGQHGGHAALFYPGQGHRVTEAIDVRVLARAIAWAGESPAAAGQIFNVTNGDVLVWQNLWPVIARQFGMEVGLPHPMSSRRSCPDMQRPGPEKPAEGSGQSGR